MSTAAATKRRRELKITLSFNPTSCGIRGLPRCVKASLTGLLTLLKTPPTAAGDERRCDLPRNATLETRALSVATTTIKHQCKAARLWEDEYCEASTSAEFDHQSRFARDDRVAGDVHTASDDVDIVSRL
ncbi:hypothetical protein MTO96_042957 [Rhipicephalus appendiculatus]